MKHARDGGEIDVNAAAREREHCSGAHRCAFVAQEWSNENAKIDIEFVLRAACSLRALCARGALRQQLRLADCHARHKANAAVLIDKSARGKFTEKTLVSRRCLNCVRAQRRPTAHACATQDCPGIVGSGART